MKIKIPCDKDDTDQLVQVLASAHCLVRDAATEVEMEAEFSAELGRPVGRGFQFALSVLPEVVVQLEELADLLAEHFGVVFLHEAPVDDEFEAANG